MIELKDKGAHNINLVTPTHVIPQIVEALSIARKEGMALPLVYNTSGYESVQTLKILDGIIDIYMPDAKYSDPEMSFKYSGVKNYWEVNKPALKEMFRQTGNLKLDENGIAVKGMLIRHLVLPNNIAGSEEILQFIKDELSPEMYISLMAQYHPAHKTTGIPELSRKISKREYNRAVRILNKLNLSNGWIQQF